MSTKGKKLIFESEVLRREVHLDVFEFGLDPEVSVFLFGGTGIDEEEYERRRESVIPLFDSVDTDTLQLRLVYATAPYDVPFARFSEFPDALDNWNKHLEEEIFARWSDTPFIVASFSGSVALILNGAEQSTSCIGGAAIAPDELKTTFACPKHWENKLAVFTSISDRVCSDKDNQRAVATLVEVGEAIEFEIHARTHGLIEYLRQGALLDWLTSFPQ